MIDGMMTIYRNKVDGYKFTKSYLQDEMKEFFDSELEFADWLDTHFTETETFKETWRDDINANNEDICNYYKKCIMKDRRKYYVEFEGFNTNNAYSMQSKLFDCEEDAIKWYKDSFDYVNMDDVDVSLMAIEYYNDGEEVKYLYDITAKYELRS